MTTEFQCSSASRKFLKAHTSHSSRLPYKFVSVLFSEPKIPQFLKYVFRRRQQYSFSALQRAENSSIVALHSADCGRRMFQCSSASRKFLNLTFSSRYSSACRWCFSALQRAENSSISDATCAHVKYAKSFSALQRAENSSIRGECVFRVRVGSFSALQRAENSSIHPIPRRDWASFWFQCSSASRKFLNFSGSSRTSVLFAVSVLFSEPKIPQ